MVDVMTEFGSRARVATWRLDLNRSDAAAGTETEPGKGHETERKA
jgi:hypothetical protein